MLCHNCPILTALSKEQKNQNNQHSQQNLVSDYNGQPVLFSCKFEGFPSPSMWTSYLDNPQINDNECLPWNMPSPDGHPCCNPIEQHHFFNTLDNLDMSKVMGAELWDEVQ